MPPKNLLCEKNKEACGCIQKIVILMLGGRWVIGVWQIFS